MSQPTCLKNGRFLCPCGCSTLIALTVEKDPDTGFYLADLPSFLNLPSFLGPDKDDKEEAPKGPGNLRPDELSTPVHESVHGQAPGRGKKA